MILSKQNVGDQHEAEADQKGVGGASLASVDVGLGDHFVADDVQHGAARKGEGEGKNGGGQTDGEISDQRADDLNGTRERRVQEGALGGNTRRQHGGDDDHSLGDVLQRDSARDHEGLRRVARAKANARRDSLGQVMYGDGHDEEGHLVKICVSVGLAVRALRLVQMGH